MTAVTVRIVRSRHPLRGHCLTVLGRVCRHGRLELLLVLPDGSKTLVPAAWTDHNATDGAVEPISGGLSATLGTVADLLAARELVSALAARRGRDTVQAARQSPSKEDSHAARTAQSAAGPGSGTTPAIDTAAPRTPARGRGHAAGRPDRQGGDPEPDRDAGESR